MSDIYQRKREHVLLCETDAVIGAGHGGLFDDLALVHNALPELAMSELDLSTRFLDATLAAPVMITGMTGGPPEVGALNRGLAQICESLGLAFGVGSQRIITRDSASLQSFKVRDAAPNVVLFGNLGLNQVRDLGVGQARALMDTIGADYMAIHVNPGQELAQKGLDADRDFRGGYETLARLVDALDGRVLLKECGTGLSPQVIDRLVAVGVRAADVSGSGGTSWIKVEGMRAEGSQAALAQLFAGWGVPTAAAVAGAAGRGLDVLASGGISDGLVAGKALALGARVVGCARPVLQAWRSGGDDVEASAAAARAFLETFIDGIRMVMALTGCRRPEALTTVPRVVGPRLQAWMDQAGQVRS
jgi:isopentenyl-diphosphate delta-isomerase